MNWENHINDFVCMPREKYRAMRARLEAAEKIIGFDVGSPEYEKYLRIWRRAKGEEGVKSKGE